MYQGLSSVTSLGTPSAHPQSISPQSRPRFNIAFLEDLLQEDGGACMRAVIEGK